MKKKQKDKVVIPTSTPRNPTVAPMFSTTKPGAHKKKSKTPKGDEYFS